MEPTRANNLMLSGSGQCSTCCLLEKKAPSCESVSHLAIKVVISVLILISGSGKGQACARHGPGPGPGPEPEPGPVAEARARDRARARAMVRACWLNLFSRTLSSCAQSLDKSGSLEAEHCHKRPEANLVHHSLTSLGGRLLSV